jgi:hypothetical protein
MKDATLRVIELGQVMATPGALQEMAANGMHPALLLMRHRQGDWGEVCAADKRANDRAAKEGERILSAHRLPNGEKVWIITEWDRSYTTLLLPEEY